MVVDEKMALVMSDLEYRIGRYCSSPRRNNYYRYPVNFRKPEDEEIGYVRTQGLVKDYYRGIHPLTPTMVSSMYYQFGSNKLMIGMGIQAVLEYLEKRYDISFNELENSIEDDEDLL